MHLRPSRPSLFSSLPSLSLPSVPTALGLVLLLGLVMAVSACSRPQEEDCKQAVANIRNLYDTAGTTYGVPPRAAIRSCRGSASRETVQCMIDAKTVKDLENCKGDEFLEAMIGDSDSAEDKDDSGDNADGDKAPQGGGDKAPTGDEKSPESDG